MNTRSSADRWRLTRGSVFVGFTLSVLALALCVPRDLPAANASWALDPSSWDFGEVVPGGSGPTKTFTLTNTGDVELSVVFVSVSGSDGAGFSIFQNKCGGKLAAGASCTIAIAFEPSSAGPKDGELSMASQGGVAPPATAGLSGMGAGPKMVIVPSTLVFEPLLVGLSSRKTIAVQNEGKAPLTLSGLSVVDGAYPNTAADVFDVVGGDCAAGVIVPPSGQCAVEIAFSPLPLRSGNLWADLLIFSDAPESSHRVPLEGIGLNPAAPPAPVAPFEAFPKTIVTARPARRTTRRSAAFRFRGSANAVRFLCQLDRPPLRPCTSPVRYRNLRAGRHRFVVRAVDETGRHGPATVVWWRIDRSPRRSS